MLEFLVLINTIEIILKSEEIRDGSLANGASRLVRLVGLHALLAEGVAARHDAGFGQEVITH